MPNKTPTYLRRRVKGGGRGLPAQHWRPVRENPGEHSFAALGYVSQVQQHGRKSVRAFIDAVVIMLVSQVSFQVIHVIYVSGCLVVSKYLLGSLQPLLCNCYMKQINIQLMYSYLQSV